MPEPAAIRSIRQAIDATTARLREADARTEALAEFVPRRRVLLLFPRAASFTPLDRVWRLGVFLLSPTGVLYSVGSTTRSVPPGYPGFQSLSAEERRGYRAAAFAGPFDPGETINFGTRVIELSIDELEGGAGPLFIADGRPLVRWNPSAEAATAPGFGAYLRERAELLTQPPGW